MIVFILGRTGSGKSTVARFLGEAVHRSGWFVQSFNDYSFLREMFETDSEHRFRATEYDGFEVLDQSVFQTAICSLAQLVQSYYPTGDQTLITVEFTSNNYRDALQCFDSKLLQDAHFLFLNVDLNTCLERTCKRVLCQVSEDDYYVKDTVLLRHYSCPYMPLCIGERKVQYLENMGSLPDLHRNLQALAPRLMEQQYNSKNMALRKSYTFSPLKVPESIPVR